VADSVIGITEQIVFYLPLLKALAIVLALAAATVYLLRVRCANHKWLTVCMRVAGTVLVLPLVLALLLLLLMAGCTSRPRILVSPDSQHIAEYSYHTGFLARDSTFVTVARSGVSNQTWCTNTRGQAIGQIRTYVG
jgi:hypothetical protein